MGNSKYHTQNCNHIYFTFLMKYFAAIYLVWKVQYDKRYDWYDPVEFDRSPFGIGQEMEYDDLDNIFILQSSHEGDQLNNEYEIRWKIIARDTFGYID